MRDIVDRDGVSGGESSETLVGCACEAAQPATIGSLYGRFVLLALAAIGPKVGLGVSSTDVEPTNEVLCRRIAELEAKNKDLEAFAHAVTHDLNGPICNLAGYADFVRSAHKSMADDELERCLSMVHRNALKLSDIIDELLLLAELRHGEAEMAELDMACIVSSAMRRLAYRLDDSGVSVVLPETWPAAVGYGPWVEEVWVNYIDNAVKYGGRPAHVELGAERAARGNGTSTSRFWVRDNGRGLTIEEQGCLFRPFTRVSQAHSEGHGLGLSVVRHIVEKLGGHVGVESSGVPGQGSVFSFTLPAERRSDLAR